jgi:large subunit ribosomal protein L13
MKTYSLKARDQDNQWFLVDAQDCVLGRLASILAKLIRGKHKITYTPHLNCGDHIIVINALKVHLTGNKRDQDIFYWHTGYPGGIKGRTKGQILDGPFPERVLIKAVERMIPRGPLGRQQMRNLHIYAGPSHPHSAQKPTILDIGSWNPKNKKMT